MYVWNLQAQFANSVVIHDLSIKFSRIDLQCFTDQRQDFAAQYIWRAAASLGIHVSYGHTGRVISRPSSSTRHMPSEFVDVGTNSTV